MAWCSVPALTGIPWEYHGPNSVELFKSRLGKKAIDIHNPTAWLSGKVVLVVYKVLGFAKYSQSKDIHFVFESYVLKWFSRNF